MQLTLIEAVSLIKSDSKGKPQINELQGSAPDHAPSQASEIPERLACVTCIVQSQQHSRLKRASTSHALGSACAESAVSVVVQVRDGCSLLQCLALGTDAHPDALQSTLL